MVTAATFALIVAAAGTAVAAYSAVQQGNEAARVGELNAAQARLDANRARTEGERQVLEQQRERRRFSSEVINTFSSRSIRTDIGTPLELLNDAKEKEAEAIANLRLNTQTQITRFRIEERNQTEAGKAAQRAGRTKAFSSLLGGASSVAGGVARGSN